MYSHELEEVFNEATYPEITFVYPKEYKYIRSALKANGKHITISGPSGTGKSTLVQKLILESNITEENILELNGRTYKDIDSILEIFSIILNIKNDFATVTSSLKNFNLIIIDDFHHLTEKARYELADKLKLWHENNVRFLIIGIASSSSELLGHDSELGIRNDPFELKKQDNTFIRELIEKGEKALNIAFSNNFKEEIIQASNGVPSVAQVICRNACIEGNIDKTSDLFKEINLSLKNLREPVLRIYTGKYLDKVVGLAKGKQQARSVHNTYFDIISEIAKSEKSEIPIEYLFEKIVSTISDSTMRSKKSTSFYNCLNNLEDVLKLRGLDDTILYKKGSSSISIEDPSFRFYLNLLDMESVKSKIYIRTSDFPYDVAVSFAGEVRADVEKFVSEAKELGLEVFYDFDQQAQLWGKDLNPKLAEIYTNQALYMVVFVSKEYPIKDWTNFEFTIGKAAQNSRTLEYILPIRMDETAVVGLNNTVGHLDYKVYDSKKIAEILNEKVHNLKK